jgi:hypothetical protein
MAGCLAFLVLFIIIGLIGAIAIPIYNLIDAWKAFWSSDFGNLLINIGNFFAIIICLFLAFVGVWIIKDSMNRSARKRNAIMAVKEQIKKEKEGK